jgi:hypothetical protein
MKTPAIALWATALFVGIQAMAQVATPPMPPPQPPRPPVHDFMKDPEWLGHKHFSTWEFAELDALVAGYVKTDQRDEDGRHALNRLTRGMEDFFENQDASRDPKFVQLLKAWDEQIPTSPMQPIVAALHAQSSAWRARGTGYASTVSPEGWRLFNERNRKAWKILMDNKERSSSIPTWYEIAIAVGIDSDVPKGTLRQLFDEGARRHPGYYPIYFNYARPLSLSWGGTWEDMDKFIREESAAKTNKEGDILYTRLYVNADPGANGVASFFEDSLVDWAKMRSGFRKLMAAYPKGERNQAAFAMFACRAKDATTYAMQRPKVDPLKFGDIAPEGVSLEVCDARFMKEA